MSHDTLPIAFPYVPPQQFVNRYAGEDAIIRGTLFPELDLPFHAFQIESQLPQTPLNQVMVLDFVCLELRLYLDTHPEDHTAAELFCEYQTKANEAKQNLQNTLESQYFNSWVYSPWPWEGEE